MGIRKQKREIAKARMAVLGFGNINKKFALRNRDNVPNWKVALYGKTGEEAHRAQMNHGKLLKAKEQGRAALSRRKVKKVEA